MVDGFLNWRWPIWRNNPEHITWTRQAWPASSQAPVLYSVQPSGGFFITRDFFIVKQFGNK